MCKKKAKNTHIMHIAPQDIFSNGIPLPICLHLLYAFQGHIIQVLGHEGHHGHVVLNKQLPILTKIVQIVD